ncbi:MAG: formylmethanofuran dehydrogenase subunit E family protein [bacterium]|nr:formylmethanofuran dehydrogenase subunit E family protein [bacterium]MDT8365943.1 formylmethanofuran dehydrogenase subunit E family protein [bacterium]
MTTALTTTLSETDLALIEQVHGHLCPMVLLGARTAKTARQLVAIPGDALHLYGYYRGYGCAIDGIQIFTGCTWGNQNLVLLRGRNFSFILTVEGAREGVMVLPRPQLLEQIRKEKTPESRSALMEMFTSAPDEEILETEAVVDMGTISGFPGN